MNIGKHFIIGIFVLFIVVLSAAPALFCEPLTHIEQLFNLRDSITNQGNILPDKIQQTSGIDRRTLERIFELNTSTLTTIEAYFRILMITIATENETNPEAVRILNEWLEFTKNQCMYDIEYLDSTLNETKDQIVVNEIITAKKSIKNLEDIANTAMNENSRLLKQTE